MSARSALIAVALIIVFGFLFWLVATASAHEWYTGLRNETGVLCCDVRDCAEVPSRLVEGRTEVLLNGQWWDAFGPWYLPGTISPDGETWHGCMLPSDASPRCTIGPLNGA